MRRCGGKRIYKSARLGLNRSVLKSEEVVMSEPASGATKEPALLRLNAQATPADRDKAFRHALALHGKGRRAEAAAIYRALVKLDARHAPAWINLGTILRQEGHYEAAAGCAARACALHPDNAGYLTNWGNCLGDLDRKDQALAVHAKAAALKPDDALIRNNYAIALREFNRFEEALAEFDAALALKPDDASLLWDRAITWLHLGRYAEGWDAFEIRWQQNQMRPRPQTATAWRGEDLTGKTFLVYEEQGFGDSILCSRFLPLLAAYGGRVVLECKAPLHRLFSKIEGIAAITADTPPAGSYDYQVPMMSLPGILGVRLETVPAPATLAAAPAVPAAAAALLAQGAGKLKVGIVWSGSTTFARNRKRAVDIARFLPLASVPGVQLYSLQKGPCEGDLAACGADGLILPLGPCVNDFADTAAVLQQLDLVIMTDSSVAHLAASLGRPVWNLLCYFPYWLYLHGREDSPWYPSMRLMRQAEPGDWDGLFARVLRELTALAAPYARSSNQPSP